jgi:hypothetical protein
MSEKFSLKCLTRFLETALYNKESQKKLKRLGLICFCLIAYIEIYLSDLKNVNNMFSKILKRIKCKQVWKLNSNTINV